MQTIISFLPSFIITTFLHISKEKRNLLKRMIYLNEIKYKYLLIPNKIEIILLTIYLTANILIV